MPDIKQSFETARNTKSIRLWFMVGLVVVLFVLWWMKIIKTGFAIGLGIILLAAIGIETFNYDLDLGRLWQTGNIQESRVTHTKNGITLMGSCAIPIKGEGDINCSNFKTQEEAQSKYDQCANEIISYNQDVDIAKIKSLDIYRLDGNKNGIVCEALPNIKKEIIKIDTPPEGKTIPLKPTTQSSTTKKNKTSTTTTTAKTPTYSNTPLLRTSNSYPISTATIKTNSQVLPIK